MKKLYYFFVNSGRILFIWSLLFIVSISFQSIIVKGQVNYGDRCYQNFNDVFIKYFKYEGVNLNYAKLECNTYYLEYDTTLTEEENITFLASISKLFYDNEVDANVHVILKGNNYQIIATIVDYRVSYTKSLL